MCHIESVELTSSWTSGGLPCGIRTDDVAGHMAWKVQLENIVEVHSTVMRHQHGSMWTNHRLPRGIPKLAM